MKKFLRLFIIVHVMHQLNWQNYKDVMSLFLEAQLLKESFNLIYGMYAQKMVMIGIVQEKSY